MRNLTLPVNTYWGGMIEDGTLDWDYREVKPYWISRICDCPPGTTDIQTIKDNIRAFDRLVFYNRSTGKRMSFNAGQIIVVSGDDYEFLMGGKYYFIIEIKR